MAVSAFNWSDVCTYVISMPNGAAQRASVLKQLDVQGIRGARVRPGIVLTEETVEAAIHKAAGLCLVPPSYAGDQRDASPRWLGTIGSTLAHLHVLHHAVGAANDCTWAMILADDVALRPSFRERVQRIMDARPLADFVNLAVVRAWGASDGDHQSRPSPQRAKRVDGSLRWQAWSSGRSSASGVVKAPNILVSGYLARRATIPKLLSSFARTQDWRRQCSVDQLLGRIQYALASAQQYKAYNIDAGANELMHCAVGAAERELWRQTEPMRHQLCQQAHPQIYGGGSRSHDRRLQQQENTHEELVRTLSWTPTQSKAGLVHGGVHGAALNALSNRSAGCFHGFRVPGERVVVDTSRGGVLLTLPLGQSIGETVAGDATWRWPPPGC